MTGMTNIHFIELKLKMLLEFLIFQTELLTVDLMRK